MKSALCSIRVGATAALAVAGLCFSVQAQAPLDIRIALVIGNSAYAGAPLVNPANDARAMGDTLRGLGFAVVELRDAQKEQMNEAIAKVRDALKGKQGVGMLYYAGHGLQLDWHNYMVPVDATLSKASDVAGQTIDVNSVIDAFKSAGNRMNILVLDACRDNPFAGTASGKGLAQLDAPPGTFLAYATAPGNVAEDGDAKGGNGLYTQYLLEELKKPTARIEDVFKRVRLNVRKQSQGRQIPWESTSLEDDFYFNTGKVIAVAKPDQKANEEAFLAEKVEWDRIKDSKKVDDFYAYLQKYPSGFISEQALFKIEQLQKAQTVAVSNRDGVVPLAAAARRFQLGDEYVRDQIDGFTKTRRRYTYKVTFADDSRAEFNNGKWSIWDQTGMALRGVQANGRIDTYLPGILYAPADMAIGKKWKTAFQIWRSDDVVETAFWEFYVSGYDMVTVPMGTFKSYLVVGRGESRYPGGTTILESRFWFDPASLRYVRNEFIFRKGTTGQIINYYGMELVSFKRGAG